MLLLRDFDIFCVHLLEDFKPFSNQRKPKCLLQTFFKDDVTVIEDKKIDLLSKNVGMACLSYLFVQI